MQEKIISMVMPLFIFMIIVELIIGRRIGRSNYQFGDTLNSMGLGALSQITFAFLQLLFFGMYIWVQTNYAIFDLPNAWWVWLGGLLLYDFLYYWLHRCGHETAILWAAHVVHHQSECYNLTTALRQTSTGPLLAWIFYLPLAFLGVPIETFVIISMVDLLYQFWVHTELIGKLGWFDRVFVSPSNHRVHHATNDIYLDKNYGGILILWDRLFGTFIEERDDEKVVYGTRSPLRSWSPVKANTEVYESVLRDARRASNWFDRIRIWFKHPGWQPDDVAKNFPHAPFVLHHPNYEPPLPLSWKWYCFIQFSIVLLITTHFLAVDLYIPMSSVALYAGWLGAGFFAVGGLTERRSGFLWFESIRLIFTIVFVHYTGHWFGEFALPVFAQYVISFVALCSLVYLFRLYRDIHAVVPELQTKT